MTNRKDHYLRGFYYGVATIGCFIVFKDNLGNRLISGVAGFFLATHIIGTISSYKDAKREDLTDFNLKKTIKKTFISLSQLNRKNKQKLFYLAQRLDAMLT